MFQFWNGITLELSKEINYFVMILDSKFSFIEFVCIKLYVPPIYTRKSLEKDEILIPKVNKSSLKTILDTALSYILIEDITV